MNQPKPGPRSKSKKIEDAKKESTKPMREDHGPNKNNLPRNVRRARAKLEARRAAFVEGSGYKRPGSLNK